MNRFARALLVCSSLFLTSALAAPFKLAGSSLSLDVPANMTQRSFNQNGMKVKVGMDLNTEMVVVAMALPANGVYSKYSDKQLMELMFSSGQQGASREGVQIIKQGTLMLNGQRWMELQGLTRTPKGQSMYLFTVMGSKKGVIHMAMVACESSKLEQNRNLIGTIIGSIRL